MDGNIVNVSRKIFCKKCHKFNSTFELLLDSRTFTNLMDNKAILRREKIQIKFYVKSKNNRTQTVTQEPKNVEKINYNIKGQKRCYKKF